MGIRRAVEHMPNQVLKKESYRRLVSLLDDPESAKLLRHAGEIDDGLLKRIGEFPPPLRHLLPFVEKVLRGWLHGFTDGLRFIAARTGRDFDELVLSLAELKQPQQFIAALQAIAEEMPLPETTPPGRIALARRLDSPSEVRALGDSWGNCLANYVRPIDDGNCAVYLWEGKLPAAGLVRRRGRFGWFVGQVLGPRNSVPNEGDSKPIYDAFAEAGVYRDRVIDAVENLIQADRGYVHAMMRRHARRQAAAETWEAMD
jgi:hypothetical protein